MSDRVKNSDQLLSRYQVLFGVEEGRRFHGIVNDWAHARTVWDDFNELFLTNQKRRDLLVESASGFFDSFFNLALHSTILSISRLLDTDSRSRSLTNFVKNTKKKKSLCDEKIEEIESDLQMLRDRFSPLKRLRDKVVAHRDFDPGSLISIQFSEVTACLDGIHSLINKTLIFADSAAMMNEVVSHGGRAIALLYVLRDGLRFDQEYTERLKRGEVSILEMNREDVQL